MNIITRFRVSADHADPRRRICACVMVAHQQPTNKWISSHRFFGLGLEYASPIRAVHGVLYENGCTDIQIEPIT